jgi:NAD(P)-dependent dehydrogenase (short-subunit alcohol dehydrogenase family)
MVDHNGTPMNGKVVVITGGNAGIGKEAAADLSQHGATVVITSRNPERGRSAVEDIRDRTDGADVDVAVVDLDLASLASVRRFAAEILDRYERLDVLLNNAGLIQSRRTETEDGFETTLGVNHLGHFALTNLLLDRLRANPGGARVVNVSSHAHKGARRGLDFDDLQSTHHYSGSGVYSKSKLANILFTRELSRRLAEDAVTVNALHPGFVRTKFGRDGDAQGVYGLGVRLAAPFAISLEKGARTSVYLASSPEVDGVTGAYFYKCHPARTSRAAADDEAARRLWSVSAELVGMS